ncbi:MAG: MFS transporter [Azospira sp.]|jgi:predicted MFS family arabinose efflux permease|nr:MFS transporter [Azospira sp.]
MTDRSRSSLLMLVAVVGAYVLSFFHRFAPAGIAQDLAVSFQTTAASLGTLAATYFYVYTVMQVPTGILVDTLGPRRILLAGAIVAAAGSVLFGMASSIEVALVGRTLIGLGVSVTFIAMLKIIAVWFDEKHFATVTGLCMLVGNLGSVLAGVPLSLTAQALGWRSVFVAAGLLSLLLGLACWIWVRDRKDGGSDAHRPKFDRTVILGGLMRVLKNRATWPAALTNAGVAGAFFAFAGLWATPYLVQVHGHSRDLAATHLSLWFGGFAVGCLLLGTISDRIKRRKPVLVAATNVFALLWLVWLSGATMPVWLSLSLFALMGLATAGFSLTWACAKEVNPPLLSGMSTSVANMGGFLTGALLQPLFGWVMDLGWRGEMVGGVRFYDLAAWRGGLAVIAVSACLGAIAAWRVRETRCRNVWGEQGGRDETP